MMATAEEEAGYVVPMSAHVPAWGRGERRQVGGYVAKLKKADRFLHMQLAEFRPPSTEGTSVSAEASSSTKYVVAYAVGRTGERATLGTGRAVDSESEARRQFESAFRALTGEPFLPDEAAAAAPGMPPQISAHGGYVRGALPDARDVALRSEAFATVSTENGFPTALTMHVQYAPPPSRHVAELPFFVAAAAHGGEGSQLKPRTTLEHALAALVGAIREKPEWTRKVLDDAIAATWRSEVLASAAQSAVLGSADPGHAFDLALAECRHEASAGSRFSRSDDDAARRVVQAGVDGVFRVAIPDALGARVSAAGEQLRRRATGSPPDYHPGSDGVVVDIVHPSLYCYERGVTPVVRRSTAAVFFGTPRFEELVFADAAPEETPPQDDHPVRRPTSPEEAYLARSAAAVRSLSSAAGLQWLPAEVDVDASGTCAFASYVNGLHPVRDSATYAVLERLLGVALPGLEAALTAIGPGGPTPRDPQPYRSCGVGAEAPEIGIEIIDRDHPDYDDYDLEGSETDERETLKLPSHLPPSFVPFETYFPGGPAQHVSLRGRRLQVIVKIARYELAPDTTPTCRGGSWHVEGAMDERIVATACCYVDAGNVTDTRLGFRVAVETPMYPQDDRTGVAKVYGLESEADLSQDRGSCATPPGSLLCWPNIFQHRLEPFDLVDKTAAGHRTIVVFFLVDPTLRVRSTATVPPQQRAWIDAALVTVLPAPIRAIGAVCATIRSYVGAGLDFAAASTRRDRLMAERRAIFAAEDRYCEGSFYNRPFSLCEH